MSNDLHCHGCGYPVHTSLASACPWCRSNAEEITRLRGVLAVVEEATATGDGLSPDETIRVHLTVRAALNDDKGNT